MGKSTLLNVIVGSKKLAKVSSTPGKTRSLNFFLVQERFHLVDLPGYGYAKVSKEMRGQWAQLIEDYLLTSEQLIGLLLLLDSRRDPTPEDVQMLAWLAERQLPVLVAVTKTDKLNRDQANRKVQAVERELGCAAMPFSSVNGTGKKELVRSILDLVQEHNKA